MHVDSKQFRWTSKCLSGNVTVTNARSGLIFNYGQDNNGGRRTVVYHTNKTSKEIINYILIINIDIVYGLHVINCTRFNKCFDA